MAWIATINISPDEVEAVTSRLWDLGTSGVAELADVDGTRLLAGFESEPEAAAAIGALGVDAHIGPADPAGWSTPALTTVSIGGRELTIDAQHAFGHGAHPTTQLCLDALVERVETGLSVLDVGTGSGVLAIAAATLGADPVVAIDIEPEALTSARANAARNETSIDVTSTPIGELHRDFDIVVVNMLIAELEPIGASIRRATRRGGTMIVSGCLVEQTGRVVPALESQELPALEIVSQQTLDGWTGLVVR